MERLRIVLFAIVISMAGIYSRPAVPTANVYYISNSGNDASNSGTSTGSPWRTLARLNSVTLGPGDQVLLNRGNTWIESLPVNQSGSSGSPITFGAYGTGANPIVTSLISLPTWTNQGGNIWTASVTGGSSTYPTMVLINGAIIPPGRFPNTGWLTMSDAGSSSFTTTLSSIGIFLGANAVMKKREWVIDKCPISDITGQTVSFINVTGFPALNDWGFFITDHEATLDLQNEWAYKNGVLKMYSTQNPSSLNVKIATQDGVLSMSGKNYIKFQNINFEGSKGDLVTISGGTGNQMLDCTLRFGGKNGLNANFMTSFTMNNCNVSYNNYSGIDAIIGTNQTFTNNAISYNGMNRALCGPNNKANHGIWVNGTGTLIQYNTVTYNGYVGIDFSGNNNSVINNLVDHFAQIVADGGGIYMSDETNGIGRIIRGNIVLNGLGPRDGTPFAGNDNSEAIYLDESTAGVLIEDNVLAFCSGGGIFVHKGHDLIFRRNLLHGNTLRGFYLAEDAIDDTRITNVTFTGNYIFSLQASDLPYSLIGTPSVDNFFNSINNNVLAKPSTTASMVRAMRVIWTGNYDQDGKKIYIYPTDIYTLPQWKAAHPTWDVNSTGTPSDFAVGTPVLRTNPSQSPVTIPLDGVYKSIKNVLYSSGSLTLQPYTAELLIRVSDLPPVSNIVNFKGRIIISNGPQM